MSVRIFVDSMTRVNPMKFFKNKFTHSFWKLYHLRAKKERAYPYSGAPERYFPQVG